MANGVGRRPHSLHGTNPSESIPSRVLRAFRRRTASFSVAEWVAPMMALIPTSIALACCSFIPIPPIPL